MKSAQFKLYSSIPWVIPTSPNKEHVGEDMCILLMGRYTYSYKIRHLWYVILVIKRFWSNNYIDYKRSRSSLHHYMNIYFILKPSAIFSQTKVLWIVSFANTAKSQNLPTFGPVPRSKIGVPRFHAWIATNMISMGISEIGLL